MARAKVVNPCIQKGRYGGSRYSGRWYLDDNGNEYEVKACECVSGFVDCDRPKINAHADAKTFKHCSAGAKSLSVIPCQEIFRNKDSTGTKRFRNSTKSKFPGCEEIERQLLEKNEVVYKSKETLGLQILIEGYSREFDVDPSERIGIFEREESELGIQEKKGRRHIKSVSRSPVYDFSGPTPRDLRHALLIELLDIGYFDYDDKLQAAAWLIHEEMTTGDWLSLLSEKINVGEFHRYQSRVYQILEQKKTLRQKKWDTFWASLTQKQQNAVELVYMKNDENRARQAIAKTLKISLESLNDRVDGAIRKLVKAFIELNF